MRRCSAVLSVLFAAGSVALSAPAADAVPLCYAARVQGALAQPIDTGRTCVPWPYGVRCEYSHTWVDPVINVYTEVCIPRVV